GTPFFTTKKSGTGLGLSVCRQIVEEHDAEMEITSQVGIGTKVKIIFPKNTRELSIAE
ncbi:MAG: ATP-binding protein, partial [Peptococcales bacterium]